MRILYKRARVGSLVLSQPKESYVFEDLHCSCGGPFSIPETPVHGDLVECPHCRAWYLGHEPTDGARWTLVGHRPQRWGLDPTDKGVRA